MPYKLILSQIRHESIIPGNGSLWFIPLGSCRESGQPQAENKRSRIGKADGIPQPAELQEHYIMRCRLAADRRTISSREESPREGQPAAADRAKVSKVSKVSKVPKVPD